MSNRQRRKLGESLGESVCDYFASILMLDRLMQLSAAFCADDSFDDEFHFWAMSLPADASAEKTETSSSNVVVVATL
jgi:hypothetical protein